MLSPIARIAWACLLLGLSVAVVAAEQATLGLADLDTNEPAHALYEANCSHCHDQGVSRAPPTKMLQFMSASAVYKTLTEGVMAPQAAKLSDAEKRQIAEFVTHEAIGEAKDIPRAPDCEDGEFDVNQPPSALNWGLTWGNSRTVTSASAEITAGDVPRLEMKWAFAFPRGATRPLTPFAGRRERVHRQPGRHRVRARSSHRLHPLDFYRALRGAYGHRHHPLAAR